MKHLFTMLILMGLILSFPGCKKHKDGQKDHSQEKDHKDHDHKKDGHKHKGKEHDLGKKKIGSLEAKVAQLGELKGGGEGVFELVFEGDKSSVAAIRIWVGKKDGEGSVKKKIDNPSKDGDHDVHVELPKKLTKESKLWVEIEKKDKKTDTGSFDLDMD